VHLWGTRRTLRASRVRENRSNPLLVPRSHDRSRFEDSHPCGIQLSFHGFPRFSSPLLRFACAELTAQEPPGLSSGNRHRTGPAIFGVQRNPSGSVSGNTPPAWGRAASSRGEVPRQIPGGASIPLGPGVNVRFPDDPAAPCSDPRIDSDPAERTPRRWLALSFRKREEDAETYDRTPSFARAGTRSHPEQPLLLAHRTLLKRQVLTGREE